MRQLREPTVNAQWWDEQYKTCISSKGREVPSTVWGDRRLNEVLLKELKRAGDVKSILWPGCGAGLGPRALVNKLPEIELVVTDWSQAALDLARRVHDAGELVIDDPQVLAKLDEAFGPSDHEGSTLFQLQDVDQIPWSYSNGQFDAVVLVEILEHASNPGSILAEALRVASKVVIVAFPIREMSPHQRWLFTTAECSGLPGFQRLHQLYRQQIVLAVFKP